MDSAQEDKSEEESDTSITGTRSDNTSGNTGRIRARGRIYKIV